MPDLAVAGLDTPAQHVRHGARMAVVPERIPAAGRGLRRSWRCALLGEHWRPSYLAERDLWLCAPASRRVCLFQSLGVVPFGQCTHELLPFEGNWTLVRRVAVWPVNPISGGIVSGGPPRMPRTTGRPLRYPSEHLAAHRPRAWFGRGPALSPAAPETSAFPAMQHWPAFAETAPETPALSMVACLSRPSAGYRWAAVGQQPRISMLRSPRVNRHRELKPANLQALFEWSQPGSNR